jgi:hypothetical protein
MIAGSRPIVPLRGQIRSFGMSGSMSGLPESGQGCANTCAHFQIAIAAETGASHSEDRPNGGVHSDMPLFAIVQVAW